VSDIEIGTVEVLNTRVYPLDPNNHDNLATTVVVNPGTYPLYRHHDAMYWMMTGQINRNGFDKIGDGLFLMGAGDVGEGPEVRFPSPRFGPEQWAKFLTEPFCTEGHPDQRLRIRHTANGGR
jgi:hypothetical protein